MLLDKETLLLSVKDLRMGHSGIDASYIGLFILGYLLHKARHHCLVS